MAVSEHEIQESVIQHLYAEPSGFLSTESLIQLLTAHFRPTGIDAEILSNRSDTHFSQKVRNLVSHRHQSTSLETRRLAVYDDTRQGWVITQLGRDYVEAHYCP